MRIPKILQLISATFYYLEFMSDSELLTAGHVHSYMTMILEHCAFTLCMRLYNNFMHSCNIYLYCGQSLHGI